MLAGIFWTIGVGGERFFILPANIGLIFFILAGDLKQRGLAEIYRVLKPGGRLLIVDMKGSANLIQQISPAALFHHQLKTDIQELTPLMTRSGYVQIETGNMPLMQVGYIRGQRPR